MSYYLDTTVGGIDVRVFLFPIDWKDSLKVSHHIGNDIDVGLSDKEVRSENRESMLIGMTGDMTLWDEAAEQWRKALASLGGRKMAFPIFPDILRFEDWGTRIYDAQWVVDFSYGGAARVIAASAVGSSIENEFIAPLVFGRWDSDPTNALDTDRMLRAPFEFIERSKWAFRVEPHSYGSGFSTQPDWADEPEEVSLSGKEYSQGVGREEITERTQSIRRWKQSANYTFASRTEIREAITFFCARKGPVESFGGMLPYFTPAAPTADTPLVMTMRFDTDRLELEYDTDASASAEIEFIQELSSATHTQTQPPRAFLARLRYLVTPPYDEFITNWDKPLVGPDGATFQPHQMQKPKLRKSLKPQDEQCELSVEAVPGSLAMDSFGQQLFAPLQLTIWQCNPANPSAAVIRWVGRVDSVEPEGQQLKIVARLLGGVLNRRFPKCLFQRRCNWCIFDSNCGLSEAAHQSTGTIQLANISADGREILLPLTGWGGPTYAANWFHGGEFRTGTGRNTHILGIVSSAMEGGSIRLKFSRAIIPARITNGQACVVIPGCDGEASTCKTKYNNYTPTGRRGFGGFPCIPDYIPQQSLGSPRASK
jgi:uncharacterized phage protein (TIGR02218 family)